MVDIAKGAIFALVLSSINFQVSDAVITADGCGETKNCFRNPQGCELSDAECRFFSWAPTDEKGMFLFEMTGGNGAGMEYVAMALAMKNQMSDADLYYCDGKAVRTGTIQARYTPPAYNEMTNGLQQKSAATVNGVAQCSFIRPASVVKTISNDEQKDFDITKEEYFLLAAVGAMVSDSSQIQKHTWRLATNASYNFAATPKVYTVKSGYAADLEGISTDGCGDTKTCFRDPPNCDIADASCRFFSWRKQSDGTFTFEIVGGIGSSNDYIAIALGTRSAMTNADMYYCDGKKVRSGVIRDLGVEPSYVTTNGLSTVSAKSINGMVQCAFNRPASVMREISGGVSKKFDLNSESYFLLAASGKTNGDKIQIHSWKTKTDNRIISSEVIRLDRRRPKFFAAIESELIDEEILL